mmetsp:Transcript_120860/g.270076  ORF Transcript_120860/g.270076 Transcript_120860/m.270076 type:complete len:318 (+) Transcript_120860:51-1004(+)|eukprot:CAMPEP_0180827248 /NCGR_PEP_ID=MMETSP1038_2-20121128/74057_1 /TAXON_ID=632150 /ORGANISM="Azadinium spinosum, Strain 3D9" /LENGTH=317 /DNA_ID=CAMNT_0022870073 /DNA_START=1 /DNA_END=954 /DNA_ORIENTATION=-
MGKDIFDQYRGYCKEPGCNCQDFVSRAQRDIERAEREGIDMMEMETKYHYMTCQAKSEYQLFCGDCNHSATVHSTKDPSKASQAIECQATFTLEEESPGVLFVLQGVLFRKEGASIEKAAVKKLKRASGTEVRVTGRCWRGPSGGLWAELDTTMGEKAGWVLIEGPGFGVDGPILGREWLSPASEAFLQALAEEDSVPPPPEPPAPPEPPEPKKPLPFILPRAQRLVGELRFAFGRPDFQKKAEDPLQVGELFMSICAKPAAEYGFGEGEDGVRKMFAAIAKFQQNQVVAEGLEELDQALNLGPGMVLAIASEVTGA